MKKILLVLLLLPGVLPILANTPPRLVINLVVSSMRPDDIDRYRSQFGTGGFLRLTEGGARFTEGSYDYQQTSTPRWSWRSAPSARQAARPNKCSGPRCAVCAAVPAVPSLCGRKEMFFHG